MVRNFTLAEFIQSGTAYIHHIDNRIPDGIYEPAMNTLRMLQYIRDHLSAVKGIDTPMIISSGYRSEALNNLVGGSRRSDHLRGTAADFTAPKFGTPTEIAKELCKHMYSLEIGQLILEYPEKGGWIHVSTTAPSKPINKVITITKEGIFAGIQAPEIL